MISFTTWPSTGMPVRHASSSCALPAAPPATRVVNSISLPSEETKYDDRESPSFTETLPDSSASSFVARTPSPFRPRSRKIHSGVTLMTRATTFCPGS